MNQGGLKHAATDSRLESKRERRRGASGRAAALRRAPSDSDCSGETASLSADSGDRVVRPPPPPTRVAKSRSRRRGSEWEVLEGLKDGQRFEKRPDVFNGYLHKKRKWPLKGWHKRFFVVDGGILVYARSPTDVARGRLHGSVDVGLSVISAKARRRRIDIDADEFIYHLRAKTPDVFRTWLNVLKAHRLYRQHLLTFGARESVPKIHAPLEDLPPTDTSSHASQTSFETSIESSLEDIHRPPEPTSIYRPTSKKPIQLNTCKDNPKSPFLDWQFLNKEQVIFFNFPKTNNAVEMKNNVLHNKNRSLCSMNCLNRLNTNDKQIKKGLDNSRGSTTTEKQVHITDLESNSIQITSAPHSDSGKSEEKDGKDTVSHFPDNKVEPTYYFFSRKQKDPSLTSVESPMKKSKKSTNLVKYRNVSNEPKLTEPISKCLLLKNYRFSNHERIKREHKDVECDSIAKENNEVQATIDNKAHKSLQDIMSTAEYDQITEKIMISLFEKHKMVHDVKCKEVEYYIGQVVRELYNVKFSKTDIHPVKMLFRSLLEYWLKNTSGEPFNRAIKRVKSVGKPSNNHFTRDKILSSFLIDNATKQTQFHGMSDFFPNYDVNNITEKKQKPLKPLGRHKKDKKTMRRHSPKRDTESFEKERRIQELEKILKNTVYVCETVRSIQSKEKDIMITRKLLDNLDKLSKRSNSGNDERLDNSQSSSELPKIQETINNLISDNAIPAGVAKGFLNAYLEILLDSSKSMTNSSSQSSDQLYSKNDEPHCDVLTESIQKRISKSMITANLEINNDVNYTAPKQERQDKDPGELYLQEVLDKIPHGDNNDKSKGDKTDKIGKCINEFPGKTLIHENPKDNSVVIDLAKYELERIYMHSDPTFQGAMSITIKLKEKLSHFGESKTQQLSLFCNDNNMKVNHSYSEDDWLNNFDSESFKKIFEPIDLNLRNKFDFDSPRGTIEVKPYSSSSDEVSRFFGRIVHESEHSIDLSFKSSNYFKKEYSDNEDTKSCYIVSSFKKSAIAKLQSNKKVRLKHGHGILDKSTNIWSPGNSRYPVEYTMFEKEYTMFEKPAPRIIDEKFILLLLENLALLSKNLPNLYKDINALYVKLKKKHDKVVRNSSNIQGLSLLGKIYNEDYKSNDQGTQYEDCECHDNFYEFLIIQRDVAVATHKSIINKGVTDRAVSTCNMLLGTTVEAQTEFLFLDFKTYGCNDNFVKEYTCMNQAISSKNVETELPLVKGTSVQKWVEPTPTKECAISTIIKTVLDTDRNFRMARNRNLENINVVRVDKEFLCGKKTTDYKTRKASTQSQTEAALNNKTHPVKELNVYRFNVSKYDLKVSHSMIDLALANKSDDLKTLYRCHSEPSDCSGLISPTLPPLRGPQAGFVSGTPGGRLASWIIESGGPLESASRELGQAQLSVQQLQRLLEALELQHQTHDTDVSLEGASPNVKKDRRKFGLRKKKSNSKCASVELAPPHIDASSSHMALSTLTAPPSPGGGASSIPNSAASLPIACAAARPQSLPGAEALGGAAGPASLTSLTPDHQLREDFTVLAKDLVTSLKSIVSTLVVERGRLRTAVEAADGSSPGALLTALRTNLNSALHQNSELRTRLSRIHDASDLAEISAMGPSDQQANRQFQQSLSYSSSCVSASEFFDAEEHEDDDLKPAEIIAADEAGVIELDGDSSSEAGSLSSEEGSASSDNSEAGIPEGPPPVENGLACWSRRTRLPCPRPTPGGPSLWNLLYKNIGKDLSQISMPVTINEPLNMLQRLCEELEYSELLDAACRSGSGVERMALVAAFAVSAYAAAAHRAASKPFNPLLAETYECVRSDKGFRFISEQVSHHPPVSACQATAAAGWALWQEARIRTKFWGKSMEFQPAGRVHLRLPSGDHYTWNKVTTCVHNLFGGQRWVDQYGDMHITCHGTDITCKLNFIKASSWSSSRHEVRGQIWGAGVQRLRIQGRWSEALYAGDGPAARCLWRPGAMPPDHEMYYGFTRFAMELNELEPGMRELLPHTDTRFRPDQRALEEGKVELAEQLKHELEQAQRERRRDNPDHVPAWFIKRMEGGEEMWVFGEQYWREREKGFVRRAPAIW